MLVYSKKAKEPQRKLKRRGGHKLVHKKQIKSRYKNGINASEYMVVT